MVAELVREYVREVDGEEIEKLDDDGVSTLLLRQGERAGNHFAAYGGRAGFL